MIKFVCFTILFLVGILILGHVWGKSDFWINILAETAGLLTGIVVTITIVEYLLNKHREKQWNRIKQITFKQIIKHIADLYSNLMLLDLCDNHSLILMVIDGRNKPSQKAFNAMTKIPEQIEKRCENRIKENEDSLIKDIENLYEKSKWDLSQILEILLPRVIQISDDRELIEKLLKLDESYREWENARIAEEEAGIGYDVVLNRAIKTFKAAAEVYEEILRRSMCSD